MGEKGEIILQQIKKQIYSPDYLAQSRFSKKDFTRKRKLDFPSLVLFMLNTVKQTLQKELTNFVKTFSSKTENITKSAFCQSRMKLKPEAFVMINDTLTKEFYKSNDEKKWKGFRLFAVDGSTLQLPNSEDIIQEFGCKQNQYGEGMSLAQISTCYDVLNEIIFDAQISHNKTHEYDLALKHLEKQQKKDLFIYDRNYGGIWFMYKHLVDKRDFLIRMRGNSIKEIKEFFDSKNNDKIIEINKLHPDSKKRFEEQGMNFRSFKIRLVKVILDNGEVEVLATSLLNNKKYPIEDFKDLYWKRWGVEVNYDHLKNNFLLEDFTGLSSVSIKQDFFASIFILNVQTLIILDVNEELKKKKINTKYDYKINRRLSIGFMKDRIIEIICGDGFYNYENLKKLFKMELVPIRPNRKNERVNKLNRRKFFFNKKRAV